jgi:hypothetical protein
MRSPGNKESILLFIFLTCLLFGRNEVYSQNGKALFQLNCAQCHHPIKVITGPALKGVSERIADVYFGMVMHGKVNRRPYLL